MFFLLQETIHQVHHRQRDFLPALDLSLVREFQAFSIVQNLDFRFVAGLAHKRGEAIQALEENDADAPLVTTTIVWFSADDFGSHVLACADDACRHVSCSTSISPMQDRLIFERPF